MFQLSHRFQAGLEAASAEEKKHSTEEDDRRKRLLHGATIHDAARSGDLDRMQTLINAFPDMKE